MPETEQNSSSSRTGWESGQDRKGAVLPRGKECVRKMYGGTKPRKRNSRRDLQSF